jgi:quinol monooxygenase YgiN
MATLVVAFLGSVVAAVGTGMLAARSIRLPRGDLIAMALAMLGLAIALGAVTVGYLVGFGPTAFRAMELGGQVLAPLALCLSLAELAGRTGPARFAGRLLLSALGVIGFVILSTDALMPAAVFGKTWPDPTVHYETVSNKLLQFGLAPVTALVAVIAILLAAIRSRRDPAWHAATTTILSAAGAALALAVPGLAALLSANFGIRVAFHGAEFAGLCLVAAALTLLAGLQASPLRLGLLHRRPDDGYADTGEWGRDDPWPGQVDETGDLDPIGADGAGLYRGGGGYLDDLADARDRPAGYPPSDFDLDRHDPGYPGGYQHPEPEHDYPLADDLVGPVGPVASLSSPAGSGIWAPGSEADPPQLTAPSGLPAAAGQDAQETPERMFGQIAIYTLLEDRVDDFDRLTERVVGQVRAMEPDTLVYIVHAVPSAPLQRILYEVYRDRAAYDKHSKQPYVAKFEADRRPYVLATNVIELGLQQAKVSPFPSISDLLDQTGLSAPDLVRPVPAAGSGQPAAVPPGASRLASSPPAPLPSSLPGPGHEPGRSGYSPAGHDRPGYDPLGLDRPGYDQPGYDRPGPDRPGHDRPGSDRPGSDRPGSDRPGHGRPSYDRPEHDPPGNGLSGYSLSGYSPSGYSAAGYGAPQADREQADREQADREQADREQADREQAGYPQAGYPQAGRGQAGLGDGPQRPR